MKKKPPLRVPIAKGSDGNLYLISDVIPSGIKLACVGCEQTIHARRNFTDGTRPHFAHNRDHGVCNYATETGRHLLAKNLIEMVVLRARDGRGPSPKLLFRPKDNRGRIRTFELPFFEIVEKELTLPVGDGKHRKPDITMRGSTWLPQCFIEVCATNAVDDARADALRSLVGVELDCQQVIDSIGETTGVTWEVKRDLGYLEAARVYGEALREARLQEEAHRQAEVDQKNRELLQAKLEELKPVAQAVGWAIAGLVYLAAPAWRLPMVGIGLLRLWKANQKAKVAATEPNR